MMHCTLIGDHSILIDFSKSTQALKDIHELSKLLLADKPLWAAEIVPGLDSLVIQLQSGVDEPSLTRQHAFAELEKINKQREKQKKRSTYPAKIHRIQVCYHPDVALDLHAIAKACKLSVEETIHLHKTSLYTADILGFMPGFAYFSGLNPKLRLPRLSSPRPAVPKGSVAIAELQTAIYPRTTPGGWNLIGRSPNQMFDIQNHPPGLFMAGDQMQIEEITLDEFQKLDQKNSREEIIRSLDKSKGLGSIEVLQSGTFTSIQDEPRSGLSHWAVGPGGACDLSSLHLANALVGNLLEMAAIEMTSSGPTLLFHQATCVAWVGGHCDGIVNGQRIPGNRPVWLAKGSTLKFSPLNPGFRALLAIGGGLQLPEILGRSGSHISADIGPKRIEKGQVISLTNPLAPLKSVFLKSLFKEDALPRYAKWHVRSPFVPLEVITPIYCLAGPHLAFVSVKERELFWSTIWTVSNQSNRMGLRLQGEFKVKKDLPNIPSQAITFGTVQFPPSHEPIVMLAEHQTTGGYPRLAEIIRADLVKLAQVKPGEKIRFIPIDIQEADRINAEALKLQESTINSIQTMIQTSGNT
ncbi:5-oxoprolinase/urea amidolyase family protein [Polynucleobacter sp. AP-Kolm-20A-A1]|uniref:5-oxoprolinase subunit B/C family protein n=1 Tax=Polynucleobacter sp. AP-Kolm-20A-A1 TaxID=2081041 RepID=UPI001BFE39F5|nr:5-oxoprolinase/urea amidolyase family protein [Polynucleobacter sp. AP-Kolm-20A-A1]QWE21056.1 5-oxoprolinase/urea amidolyase family protein [Polynucleobacter sp. AP-Kolm-20A-A1]